MGRRGPPRTPTALLKLRGSWRAKTRQDEPQPPPGLPVCPDWLNPEEAAEWQRLVALLAASDVVSVLDATELARYCRLLVKWRNYKDPTRPGAVRIAPTLAQLSAEFGLTPASRARVVTTKKQTAVVRVRERA
jgi:phage terminase small subunit